MMIGKVTDRNFLSDSLFVIDEAHHASAGSYQELIQSHCTNLLLTATPKRMDDQPIGLDIIAYQTTYKKLFSFGCVMEPDFYNFSPINAVSPFENETSINEFAKYILENLSQRDQKSLVCALRKNDVERLYYALHELINFSGHDYLTVDDIYYAHGDKNSSGLSNEQFFDECAKVQNGILISTSSLISEGFDDPIIDSVYVTYASKSISHLMQTAGRALRYHDDKNHAAVIQVRSNQLEYFFEKRWLYQDISDRYRPQLIDISYNRTTEILSEVSTVLAERNINLRNNNELVEQLSKIEVGQNFRLFLIGLPYLGDAANFAEQNQYKALVFCDDQELRFVENFNKVCDATGIEDSKSFLINKLGIRGPEVKNSFWYDVIQACQKARREVDQNEWGNRGVTPELGTTWFINISVEQQLDNKELVKFLSDCVNKEDILSEYNLWEIPPYVLKIEEPIHGYKAHCLNQTKFDWLVEYRDNLRSYLLSDTGIDAWARVAQFNYQLAHCPLPVKLLLRLPELMKDERLITQVFHQNGSLGPQISKTNTSTLANYSA